MNHLWQLSVRINFIVYNWHSALIVVAVVAIAFVGGAAMVFISRKKPTQNKPCDIEFLEEPTLAEQTTSESLQSGEEATFGFDETYAETEV